MGISPFMAFAKGALEGYNQIQDEERATIAETGKALQIAKAKALAEGNLFTSQGEGGLLTHDWQLSSAKAQPDRYIENIQNGVKNFSPAYMDSLQQTSPDRYNSIMGQMYSWMARYKTENVKELESGEVLTPNEKLMPDVMNNKYWGPHWAKVIGGKVEGAYMTMYQEGNNLVTKNIRPTYDKHGFDGTKDFNAFAYYHAERRGDTSVNTPEAAGQKYFNEYSKVAPLYVSNLLIPEFDANGVLIAENPMATNVQGKFLTIGMAFEEIVKGGIVNQGLVNGLDYTIRRWNETAGKDQPITNDVLVRGLKLAAATEHNSSGQSSIYDRKISGNGSGGVYLKEVLMLDLKNISSKVNASQEVKRTIGKITKIYDDNLKIGQHPPSSTFANNVVQMFSAFFEEGNIKDQIGDSLRKKTMDVFGVTTDDTAMTYLQQSYDTSVSSNASAGAKMEFYQNMLAYQLAVAIQGGTGGRTVSDQDVINMRKAFGNRLFSNGVVQLSVLKEIDSFVDDIIDSNKFLVDARDGTVADAKAANAFHKIKAGGLDLTTASSSSGSRATEAFGVMLDSRLTAGIEKGKINIIERSKNFNPNGTRNPALENAGIVIQIPDFNRTDKQGRPTKVSITGNNVFEVGAQVFGSYNNDMPIDAGILDLYREGKTEGSAVLQQGVTEGMVRDYLLKVQMLSKDSIEGKAYANDYMYKGLE
jgi:hypothetical protein